MGLSDVNVWDSGRDKYKCIFWYFDKATFSSIFTDIYLSAISIIYSPNNIFIGEYNNEKTFSNKTGITILYNCHLNRNIIPCDSSCIIINNLKSKTMTPLIIFIFLMTILASFIVAYVVATIEENRNLRKARKKNEEIDVRTTAP